MNSLKFRLLSILLAAAAFMQPVLAASPDSQAPRIRVIPKPFALTGDQSITLSHSTMARIYRVCVDEGQGSMAVTVTSDDSKREIASGTCWDFNARVIEITPAGRLDADEELKGYYERIRL